MSIFGGFGRDSGKKKEPPPPARTEDRARDRSARPAASRPASPQEAKPQAPAADTRAPADTQQPGSRVIEKLEDVPSNQGLLTVGHKAVHRLPREAEFAVVAIERGPKRAAIMYDPSPAKATVVRMVLQTLRTKLITEGYFVEPGEHACKGDILKQMIENFVAKHGVEGGDINVASRAKTLFTRWMDIAVKEGATDIHIEVKGDNAIVLLRVDGELERLKDESNGFYTAHEGMNAMAYPFNSMSGKGTNSQSSWDKTQNLYCMTEPRAVHGKQVSLRYQSLRGYMGPKVIARLLNTDPNAPTLTYEQLGYAASQKQMMLDVANMPSGFVLFAGVTGSGKTTSLKTFIETHPGNGSSAFYSIEDPVEYPLKGVHQIVIQRDVSDKAGSMRVYNETIASLMRADPDAVSIGEIRDSATAGAGQSIVETGHMALGTVHAHLIPGIIPRLTNEEVGMSRDVLTNPNMLSLLAYQALVPKLCPHCKHTPDQAIAAAREKEKLAGVPTNEADHLVEILQLVEERFKLPREVFRFRNLEGCEKCSHRGTKGLTVVAEMTIPDRPWLALTREFKDYEAMVHYRSFSDGRFDTENMTGKTCFEHTLYKSFIGLVDLRQCERFDSFKRFEIRPGEAAIRPTR